MKQILVVLLLALPLTSYSKVEIFTEHTVEMPLRGSIDSPIIRFEDTLKNTYPYIGTVGASYKFNNSVYSLGYEYKQGTDLKEGNIYDYSGIFLKFEYTHCMYKC